MIPAFLVLTRAKAGSRSNVSWLHIEQQLCEFFFQHAKHKDVSVCFVTHSDESSAVVFAWALPF